ncbi:MAG: repeat domain in Vibrio, Colwellia, Bradyrhizobium and Shewanella [Fluviicola sp.]|jgi:uncharacterized repeat protein (TIGR01451 family)|uniref:T9SS type A sorting domain-containing protein n=1 Tax=Fluviicola sp. TaxID=1917219 RepID=UPI0026200E92|nr:T9SS type A sorting domain-containing protein [Fluviicola sp.]MDF3025721.1 repeat domain in Vibrio, Colwellia, Bradyrhizobium and Shewanella [Fluviicola sp.]
MRLLAPLIFFLIPVFSYTQFAPESIINISGNYGTSVRTFDCDSDGDQDVVAGMEEGVFLFINNGTGAMSTPKLIKKGTTKALAVADLDGDGISDIASSEGTVLHLNRGLGNGNYAATDSLVNLNYFNTLSAADMDGDGDEDLITSSMDNDFVNWYENDGSAVFQTEHFVGYGWNPTSVFVADLDNDGDNDVVFCFESGIIWNENLGNGSFGSSNTLLSSLQYPEAVYAADMDNDGDIDILAGSRGDDKIEWFRNDSGVFTSGIIISTSADTYDLLATDVDADGDLDIVYGGGGETALHENLGSGNFGPKNQISTYTVTGGIRFMTMSDLDNNGTNDLVTISTDNYPKVLSFLNTSGTFGTPNNILSPAMGLRAMITMDVDIDGDEDLITISYDDDKIAMHENLGNGIYTPQKLISNQANGPVTVLAVDMDGDQLLDLVSASPLDNKIAWYKNTGGQFAPQQVITTAVTGVENITAADFDNDGDIDIAAAFLSINRFVWFENLGGATFSSIKFISALNAISDPKYISTADMDGDGIKDVIGFCNAAQVLWYKKNGANWTSKIVGIDGDISSIAIADMDNDHDNDVVVSIFGNGAISWFENPGNGVFTGVENNIDDEYPGLLDLKLVDMDLDGDTDILTSRSTYLHNGVCWFENHGNGQFDKRESGSLMNFNSGYSKVMVADVDNDGDQDVFTIFSNSDKIALNKNDILAPFQARGNFYIDANQNGQRDSLEIGIALPNIISIPSDVYHYTFDNGRYSIDFDPTVVANYELTPSDYPHWGITSDSLSYHVSVTPGFVFEDSLDFGFYPTDLFDSLTPNLSGEFPRCNSIVNYWLSVKNNGTTQPSGVMEFVLDTNITFISADITPDSIVSNHYYWSFDSLDWFTSTGVLLQLQLPDFNSMGDTLSSSLTAISHLSGNVYSDQFDQILVCAYDPNDKAAEPVGFGPEGFILPDVEYIDYTIRFQNTGNDTSITVVIRDQLDTNFVWNSLSNLASSHPVETTINAMGELVFNFDQINLPDSIVNEPASHGFVKYRIWLKEGLPIGTSLKNTANIYFDYNPAVVTNTTIHTLFECSELQLLPMTTVICQGTELQGNISNILYDQVSWKIDQIFELSSDELIWNADTSGTFDLEVIRYNPYCYADTVLAVTIYPTYTQTIDSLQICSGESINIFGTEQTTSGNYFNELLSVHGCDSVVVINLQVNPNPVVQIGDFSQDTICIEGGLVPLPSGQPTGGLYSGNGISGSSFNPVVAGTGVSVISYIYDDSLGCSDSDFATITVETCLNIDENPLQEWNLYPNPATNQLFIESVEAITISIIDMTGKTIQQETLKSGKNELDVSLLTNGVYLIRSKSGGNTKFVKQ